MCNCDEIAIKSIMKVVLSLLKKRFLKGASLGLFFILLIASVHHIALATTSIGDVNADGCVSAADAAVLLRELRNPSLINTSISDVSKNGISDLVDTRIILNYACGNIPVLEGFGEKLQNGLCDEKLFTRFSYTGVVQESGKYYRDDVVSVEITCKQFEKDVNGKHRKITCYIAEICLQDISYFQTALSSNAFHAKRELVFDMAKEHNALIAISGDFYDSSLHSGPVNRNGVWYRTEIGEAQDLCVLQYDGTLRTLLANTYNEDDLASMNPYQLWCFGPSLITSDGLIPEVYNSTITEEHPRSAIGSDGPGHYFFVLADGRRPEYSSGLNLQGLSELFLDLGCTVAYNLDGGRTAVMASKDSLISIPIGNQRPVSDVLYISTP